MQNHKSHLLYTVVLTLCFFSTVTKGESCVTTKEMVQLNSEKNQDKIEIEVSINGDDFVVYVFMPKEIDGNTLEAAYF